MEQYGRRGAYPFCCFILRNFGAALSPRQRLSRNIGRSWPGAVLRPGASPALMSSPILSGHSELFLFLISLFRFLFGLPRYHSYFCHFNRSPV